MTAQPCLFFYSGPEGYFYAETIEGGERILKLMNVDSNEWTATKFPIEAIKRVIEATNEG